MLMIKSCIYQQLKNIIVAHIQTVITYTINNIKRNFIIKQTLIYDIRRNKIITNL